MRRQDIQLRAAARYGDKNARLQLAQKYLRGASNFPKHIQVGLNYLQGLQGAAQDDAARIIAEALSLDEILRHRLLDMLARAAQFSALAKVKLGAWRLACGQEGAALALLQATVDAVPGVRQALETYADADSSNRLADTLACLCGVGKGLHTRNILLAAAHQALEQLDLNRLGIAVGALQSSESRPSDDVCQLVTSAVLLAETQGRGLVGLEVDHVQACLEHQCAQGADAHSWFVLGRALSGIACGQLAPEQLVRGPNLRKGTALLVRAADAGRPDAWLHLYRLSSNHRCSVANPQMARFYLEKAAQSGQAEGQRRLGALMLRESTSLRESEQAIAWLHKAAAHHDEHAKALLATLVFPVLGREEEAQQAISDLHRADPWLATRLQLARDFGLTKLEALTVDAADGQRPWGLVVGRNPFISHVRLSAPRAVPALNERCLRNLTKAAAFFGSQNGDSTAIEGDLRRRSATQRRLFRRFHLSEEMFFVSADSWLRDSMRVGSRWAHRSKECLQMALAN